MAEPEKRYTFEEYLELERAAETKHELVVSLHRESVLRSRLPHYQRIPSLKEYVLVSQEESRVERYRRNESGTWEYVDVSEGRIELASGAVLDLARLYAGLPT